MALKNGSETKKVLIVDDDPFIVDMYVLKLKKDNFEVEIASDGKAGLKKAETYNPDIILLDIVMPSVDGFELLKQLKERDKKEKKHTKVILLTNLGQKEDVERGMQLGADDYLIKAHFTPTEIVEKVREMLAQK